jgi:hypothetical protein
MILSCRFVATLSEDRIVKTFRLLTSSKNCNSFSLRGYILVAKDGEAWEIGSNDLNAPRPGVSYGVICRPSDPRGNPWGYPRPNFAAFGWGISRRLEQAPQAVIDLAWKEPAPC